MLTGKTRIRSNWLGQLIVQVQTVTASKDCQVDAEPTYITWRDARVEDLTELAGLDCVVEKRK